MRDLSDGVRIVQDLVRQSLSRSTEPFLTSSRLMDDIRQTKEYLMREVAGLSTEGLATLFPVVLFLQGYEILKGETFIHDHFWQIQFQDSGGICHVGVGALVDSVHDLLNFQELMKQHNYAFGVFFLKEKASLILDSMPNQVNIIDQDGLTTLLLMLAVTKYVDIFALTIGSIPGLREKVRVTIEQETEHSWKTIKDVSERWAKIAED